MTLREICETLGVSRRALQGYEKAGLVTASGRNKYGHLLYDKDAEMRIAQIKFYQQLGFSIKEITMIIDAPDTEKRHWNNSKNPTDASLMADYMSYMSKYDDFIKKFDQWGGEDLNDAEFAYYMEVQTRAYERLAEAAY